MEVITSEERFWDACQCASLVMGHVSDLLGLESTTWKFGKAIVRAGHVSTMFHSTGARDGPLELWVSATHDGASGWILSNTELPERLA